MKYLAAGILIIAALAAGLFVMRAGNNATDDTPQPLNHPPRAQLLVGAMENFTPAAITTPVAAPVAVQVPDTLFQDFRGDEFSLSDFRGKTVLINFWATWCGPCKREMPSLDRLQSKFSTERFVVLPISIDRYGANAVLPFFEDIGVKELTSYYDPPNALGRAMGTVGLPTSVLVDANGFEIGRLVAPAEWDSPEAVALIKSILE